MSKKTLALLGATGRTGRLVIAGARARGVSVRALARDPAKLSGPDVTVVKGDVRDETALSTLFSGADAVVSALGTRTVTEGGLQSVVMAGIVEAMKRAGVRRYVALSSAAARLPSDTPGLVQRALLSVQRLALPRYFADKQAELDALIAADLDWTLLRVAGRLVDGSGRGLRLAPSAPAFAKASQRQAVAQALLDAAIDGKWPREAPVASGD
jgi:putative NADH-flavin reductase